MGASWATKCAHQIDQSDLASLAPKVRVIQYPMNCHPKLMKVVLCPSRLRHNAWTTSASSALSTGSVEILWVVFLKHYFSQKMSIEFYLLREMIDKDAFASFKFLISYTLCVYQSQFVFYFHTWFPRHTQLYRSRKSSAMLQKPALETTVLSHSGAGGEGGGGLRTPWPLPPWWPRPQ